MGQHCSQGGRPGSCFARGLQQVVLVRCPLTVPFLLALLG